MNDSQISGNRRYQRAQRGVSLIEVLVVLVILVTGILTIIRLFPSGFFSIQSTANAGLADSMGNAAIGAGAQNSSNLPDSILPDNLLMDDLASATMNAAAYANYDPDDPNNLENARVVSNETISVPTASNGRSVYVVKYGPVVMPADPTGTAAALPLYFTVNSPNWTALSGNYVLPLTNGTVAPADLPQDTLVPGQERFLVDLTHQKIAVPYAAYTLTDNTTTPPTYTSYPQKMIVAITCSDGNTYTKYLDVPAGITRNSSSPYAPFGSDNQTYLADVPGTGTPGSGNYQGGWFDPTTDYQDTPTQMPSNVTWVSVTLYRPYQGILTPVAPAAPAFSNDPYEFTLLSPNIVTTAATGTAPATGANPGAVGFNPKAATGSGAQARKAQISYITYAWSILHEDHDIPSLTGTGSTFVVRTTVPNLLLAGSANPDNSINSGIAGSNDSLVILDLDTGQIVAPVPPSSPLYDPTNSDAPVNNEDVNGTKADPKLIDVSYALGRLTFGSNAFGDNVDATGMKTTDGSGTAPAHRIRIFYTADLNWTVAVQKAPAYFQPLGNPPVLNATGTTALMANQFAYDQADAFVYFARCNAGKTVEIDGSYTQSNGLPGNFSDTVSIDPVLYAVGDSAVQVNLRDGNKFEHPIPVGAIVTFSAVRGLSARAVVAWKERNQWKAHSVDAVLNRTP